ncbi:hypothetical protein D3C84_990520 [compost metagenome]
MIRQRNLGESLQGSNNQLLIRDFNCRGKVSGLTGIYYLKLCEVLVTDNQRP